MSRTVAAQLARYLLTGGLAAVVDIGLFAILHRLGWPIAWAATMSFCLAAAVNYLLTARFVFATRSTVSHFGLFFVVALVGLGINVAVTVALATGPGVMPELAKIGAVGVAFLANFSMNKFIVFRR